MLTFDNAAVTPTNKGTAIVQYYAFGKESGHAANGDLTALLLLRDELNKAIDQLTARELERLGTAPVFCFETYRKKHG